MGRGAVGVKFPGKITVGDKEMELDSFTEQELAVLRKKLRIPDDFLKDNFDHSKMKPGGGKGGDCMAQTKDKRFFIKDLNPGDYNALVNPGFLAAYREHITPKRVPGVDGPGSLITRIVAVIIDATRPHGKMLVMSNSLPQIDPSWAHPTEAEQIPDPETGKLPPTHGWTYLMDLKCNRDDKLMQRDGLPVDQVHKRCWKCNWLAGEAFGCEGPCCVPEDRRLYNEGKIIAFEYEFSLTPEDALELQERVSRDVHFFQNMGLMDYSAIIGAVRLRDGAKPPEPSDRDFYSRPYIARDPRGVTWAYYWGMIDFLQLWTTGKKVAHVIKCLFAPKPISTVEPGLYGDQFLGLVEERLKKDGQPWRFQEETEPLAPDGAAAPAPPPQQMEDVPS